MTIFLFINVDKRNYVGESELFGRIHFVPVITHQLER